MLVGYIIVVLIGMTKTTMKKDQACMENRHWILNKEAMHVKGRRLDEARGHKCCLTGFRLKSPGVLLSKLPDDSHPTGCSFVKLGIKC